MFCYHEACLENKGSCNSLCVLKKTPNHGIGGGEFFKACLMGRCFWRQKCSWFKDSIKTQLYFLTNLFYNTKNCLKSYICIQMTVTSRLFLLMHWRVKLRGPFRSPSPSWGEEWPAQLGGEARDRLEACKGVSPGWRVRSMQGVCSSSWSWLLTDGSADCWFFVNCRSRRSSNSSLFSSSASANSCLLRRSAPNTACMSHITRDIWPCRRKTVHIRDSNT